MFDFDAGKFLIIGVVALIVIGPKELPRVLRQIGQTVGRVRRMAAEFQGQFMDAMKEADIESIRQDLKKIGDEADAGLKANFDPARDIQRELTASLEAPVAAGALPAMTELPASATEGFALPAPADEVVPDAASAGIAPFAAEEPALADGPALADDAPGPLPLVNGAAATLSSVPKRKIRMPKRRVLALSRVHAVTDRTAERALRQPRLRAQEFAER